MCLQDLAITQGLSLRVVSGVADANTRFYVGDLRRMVMMFALSSGNLARLAFVDAGGTVRLVPSDTRYSTFDGSQPQYTRESIGPFMFQPVFFLNAGAGDTILVYIYEYDSRVDAAVNTLFGGVI